MLKNRYLFRGLRKDGMGWEYGLPTFDFKYIFNDNQFDSPDSYEVIPESVSQFTGLTDKNGTKIFENDKLRDNWVNDLDEIVEDYCVVVWDKQNGQWAIDNSYKKDGSSYTNLVDYLGRDNLEVIGNIHEK